MEIAAKPRSIVRAILKVKSALNSVAKSEKNDHGKYMFASTDAVYAELTHKMADAGLVIDVLEMEPTEIVRVEVDVFDREGKPIGKKAQQWGKFCFGFQFSTEDDSWCDPRARRTLFIQITGPQTFQAAQSYADKSHLRSLFKLPTGDFDLDALPEDVPDHEQTPTGARGKSNGRKSSAEGKRDGTVKVFNEIKDKITKASSADMCRQVWLLYAEELTSMSRTWFDTLCEDFVVTMKSFGVELELDNTGWPIVERGREAA